MRRKEKQQFVSPEKKPRLQVINYYIYALYVCVHIKYTYSQFIYILDYRCIFPRNELKQAAENHLTYFPDKSHQYSHGKCFPAKTNDRMYTYNKLSKESISSTKYISACRQTTAKCEFLSLSGCLSLRCQSNCKILHVNRPMYSICIRFTYTCNKSVV